MYDKEVYEELTGVENFSDFELAEKANYWYSRWGYEMAAEGRDYDGSRVNTCSRNLTRIKDEMEKRGIESKTVPKENYSLTIYTKNGKEILGEDWYFGGE